MIIYANSICANCRHFTWSESEDDASEDGKCRKHATAKNGRNKACREFDFSPIGIGRRDTTTEEGV